MKLLRASELNCVFDSCSAQEETLALFANAFAEHVSGFLTKVID